MSYEDDDRWMGVPEAARRFGVRKKVAREWAQEGEMGAVQAENGRHWFRRSAVEREHERREDAKYEGVHEHRVGRERSRFHDRAW